MIHVPNRCLPAAAVPRSSGSLELRLTRSAHEVRKKKNFFLSDPPKLLMFSPESRQSFLYQLPPKIVRPRPLVENDASSPSCTKRAHPKPRICRCDVHFGSKDQHLNRRSGDMCSWRHQGPVTRCSLLSGSFVSTCVLVVDRDGHGGVSQVTKAPKAVVKHMVMDRVRRLIAECRGFRADRVHPRVGLYATSAAYGSARAATTAVSLLAARWASRFSSQTSCRPQNSVQTPPSANARSCCFVQVAWASTCDVGKKSQPSLLANTTTWSLVASATPSRLPQGVRGLDHQTPGWRSTSQDPA